MSLIGVEMALFIIAIVFWFLRSSLALPTQPPLECLKGSVRAFKDPVSNLAVPCTEGNSDNCLTLFASEKLNSHLKFCREICCRNITLGTSRPSQSPAIEGQTLFTPSPTVRSHFNDGTIQSYVYSGWKISTIVLAISLLILLAGFIALLYFYHKRGRESRIAQESAPPGCHETMV